MKSKMSVKAATLRWRSWADRVPCIGLWANGSPLRVATDCSGLGCAEVSLQTIAAVQGGCLHHVFSCDVWSGSQRWLKSIGMKVILRDMNMRIWNGGRMTTKVLRGKVCTFGRSDEIVSMRVASCAPPLHPMGNARSGQTSIQRPSSLRSRPLPP